MFKLYKSGKDFWADNERILAEHPLETVFFEGNAKAIEQANENDFLVRVDGYGKLLLAVHYKSYPMVIFGDIDLCREFAEIVAANNLTFDNVLGDKAVCEKFLDEYESLAGGSHAVNHAMDIMCCRKVLTSEVGGVERPTPDDVAELVELRMNFLIEAMGEKSDSELMAKTISDTLSDYAVIRQDGKIVAIAANKRQTNTLASISDVYTLPKYRCKGLSCKVVTFLTKEILNRGKLPYLFVEKTNPISNHLYQKIGYEYVTPQFELRYTKE